MALAFSSEEKNPVIRAFIRAQVGSPGTFNSNIHESDEVFLNDLVTFGGRRDFAVFCYLRAGQQMMQAVRNIVEWKFGSFDKASAFLDFACGYGRFTRFLVQELPSKRVWSSDIYADAVAFQRQQFGVNGIVSVARPEDYACDQRFDCIFVASLFTHLPRVRFTAWLRKLYSLLTPDGMLIFSVHDAALLDPGAVMPDSGIHFVERSESRNLSEKEYGTTVVTEAFVARAIHDVTNGKGSYRRLPRELCHHQDLYVVAKNSRDDFSVLDSGIGPLGKVDFGGCALTRSDELSLTGWAAEVTPGAWIQDIQVLVNGRMLQRCLPFAKRPDAARQLGEDKYLWSGFECRCRLPNWVKPSTDILLVKAVSSNGLEFVLHTSTIEVVLARPSEAPGSSGAATEVSPTAESLRGQSTESQAVALLRERAELERVHTEQLALQQEVLSRLEQRVGILESALRDEIAFRDGQLTELTQQNTARRTELEWLYRWIPLNKLARRFFYGKNLRRRLKGALGLRN